MAIPVLIIMTGACASTDNRDAPLDGGISDGDSKPPDGSTCSGCGDDGPCSDGQTCNNEGTCVLLDRNQGGCDCNANCSTGNCVAAGDANYCCDSGEVWNGGCTAATIYWIEHSDTTVNGSSFCGGSPCTASDVLLIRGGTRGDLALKNLDGQGQYISIRNETVDRVVIDHDNSNVQFGVLLILDCKYIDIRGDNNNRFLWTDDSRSADSYGIVVLSDSLTQAEPCVNFQGESDHIKLGYLELSMAGTVGDGQSAISFADPTMTSDWTYDTFEIHHNYIHDTRYAGMYLGANDPASNNRPYRANFHIHHNLLEDLGSYGFNYKGVSSESTDDRIHHNIIRRTALVENPRHPSGNGISLSYFYGESHAKVYNNRVESTMGTCIRASQAGHKIYNNLLLGCGTYSGTSQANSDCVGAGDPYDCCTGNEIGDCWPDEGWQHGIVVMRWNAASDGIVEIYNNTIVKPKLYGISGWSITYAILNDNFIVQCGQGEWESVQGEISEGVGDYQNTVVSDANNAGFLMWSDDGNYSNDNFDLSASSPAVDASGESGYPPIDFDGVNRPQGGRADDGAYEYE